MKSMLFFCFFAKQNKDKMNVFAKAIMPIVLMLFFAVSCNKPDEPDNGGNNGNNNTLVEHEYVDLGLPSGTLWATCNVGADNPEDIGDYFAWGETMPKDIYDWSNYRYGGMVNGLFAMTKYCTDSCYGFNGFVDNLTVLEPADDAATANWGSDWRMPTKEDWKELYLKTTCTWITQNGVDGRLFTSWNGNILFLPATGFRLEGELIGLGLGIYWSSSLHTDFNERGWSFHFEGENCHVCGTYERNRGQVVRAVRASK